MQKEWAFYIVIIAILFTLIRHVPTDTNETENTHTQIPQLCWMALSWTHCTKKRPAQIPKTCGLRFWNDSFQAGVFDIQDEKSVEPFTKDFVTSDVDIDNRPAVIQTDTLDTRQHSTLSSNYNDNFSQTAYIFHPFATFFLENIFHTHAR
jgi:hypothetical protein